jgi:hypothetical protein
VLVTNPGVTWAQLAAYKGEACGLSAAGTAFCWGFYFFVGAGPSPGDTTLPVPVAPAAPVPQTWARLSTGCMALTTLAVATGDAAIYGWGARRRREARPRKARTARPPALTPPARPPAPPRTQG